MAINVGASFISKCICAAAQYISMRASMNFISKRSCRKPGTVKAETAAVEQKKSKKKRNQKKSKKSSTDNKENVAGPSGTASNDDLSNRLFEIVNDNNYFL